MPRNGSGSYGLPSGNPFVPNTVISSTTMNNTMSDIATALTQSISNDGQTTPVANLPMATFRHTNVGNAVSRNEYAAAGQVQDSSLQFLTSVAGTDTITASITPSPTAYAAGQTFRFVAAGANTTTAVTLNINGLGAKNITKIGSNALNAGDIKSGQTLEVVYNGTSFQLSSAPTVPVSGQCRMAKSGANLVLTPMNGNRLTINGVEQVIPSSGVSLSPSGATPNTTYFIYAFMSSGTMTLEFSTTAHATDSATGVEIKSGDATRTLVGMARAITGPAWQDANPQKFVLSWFNRRTLSGLNVFTTNQTTTSVGTYVELSASSRVEFLTWGDNAVDVSVNAPSLNSGANTTYTSIGIDGTTAQDVVAPVTGTSVQNASPTAFPSPSEGYHFATILGRVSGGTGTWAGTATDADRTSIRAIIHG